MGSTGWIFLLLLLTQASQVTSQDPVAHKMVMSSRKKNLNPPILLQCT